MRNRELWLLFGGQMVLAVLGCALVGSLGGAGALAACAACSVVLVGSSLAFTLWRYHQIRILSASVAHAAAEGQPLDLRTNREGELSILKNDLYKITAALAGQNSRLAQDKQFLADTLSDISHQLKTPLTSLMVHTDLLQDESLAPEKRSEFLARITAQLERLRWLVNALLRLSRLDARVVQFHRDTLQLHRLLAHTLEPLLPLAEQRDVAIQVECPRGLEWNGDADWTAEALGNLVKNCLEHTPPGGGVLLRCVDNPLHTQLVIEDNGPGFAAADLPRLFERFYRGVDAAGREGVGIGLAMARSILQSQHADVVAENRPEGGARFTVKLYKQQNDETVTQPFTAG